ncbi:MAG TPA: hypothetical protein VFI08_00410 [Spirochaetia bacterium]|nr:hypothetical protein [Spirochaetia bacterium]
MKAGRRAAALVVGLLIVAGIVALLVGRSSRFQAFAFETPPGASIAIWQSGHVPRAREASFRPAPGRPSSPEYHLASPVTVASSGEAFAFTYTSDLPSCTLTVYSDRARELTHATLPPTAGNPVRYLVPVASGSRVWGYRLRSESDAGTLAMRAAGILAFVHGFSMDPGLLTVDGSVEVLSASASAVSARITEATRGQMQEGVWLMRLALADGAAGGRVQLSSPDGGSVVFEINAASTPGWVDFARGSIPFIPRDISFTGALRGLQILRVDGDAPLPADPGQILDWDRSSWRKSDYELFCWSRYPRVLIMDTASYEVQDAMFKRLAFFVEKAGHAGKLQSMAALAGLHGYNAHDYRPEDLARFFAAASHDPSGLSPEENALQGILVDNGVIRKTSDGFAPGDGAILSISRSSSPLLRSLLLTHECFHGLFFTMPAFRDATEKQWSALTPAEQAVWVDYLGTHGYDTTDHYLVVNEFQSYLLQQSRSGVWGFQDVTLERMRAASPREAGLARRMLAARRTSFIDSFDALDAALQSAGGPPGGEAIGLRRVEPGSSP